MIKAYSPLSDHSLQPLSTSTSTSTHITHYCWSDVTVLHMFCQWLTYTPLPSIHFQLLLLSYRLEHTFVGLCPAVVLQCRLVRVAAHSMSLLLAFHLEFDTENRCAYAAQRRHYEVKIVHIHVYMLTFNRG